MPGRVIASVTAQAITVIGSKMTVFLPFVWRTSTGLSEPPD
jgi:hypothetical protein